MNTAVQLRAIGRLHRPRCDLVHGVPREIIPGQLGAVALFSPGELVAYRVTIRRRGRLFVFRTLLVDDPLAVSVVSVPGVRPRVRLLVELRSASRIRLARTLFPYLVNQGLDPNGLPDAFYLRIGTILGGRLPKHKVLLPVLERHAPVALQCPTHPVPF